MTILVRNVTQHYTVWSLEALNPRVLHRIGNSSNTDLILCCRSVSSLDPELNQPWTCARLGPLCAQGENGQGPNTGAIEDFESNGTWFHPEECLWWVDRSVPVPHLKQLYMLIPGPHAKAQRGGGQEADPCLSARMGTAGILTSPEDKVEVKVFLLSVSCLENRILWDLLSK